MRMRHADPDNDAILIRQAYNQETDKSYWLWAHPDTGEVHGSVDSDYITFETRDQAIHCAEICGYVVKFD